MEPPPGARWRERTEAAKRSSNESSLHALVPADGARDAAMRAAEARLLETMPVIPLWYYRSGALVAPRVTGWIDNPGNVHPSAALSLRRGPAIAIGSGTGLKGGQ